MKGINFGRKLIQKITKATPRGVVVKTGYQDINAWSLFEDGTTDAGFVVKGFLGPSTCKEIKDKVEALDKSDFNTIQEGFYTLPASVAHKSDRKFDDPQTVSASDFEKSNQFRKTFPSKFGVDLEEQLTKSLQEIFRTKKVGVPMAGAEQDPLTPFSIRVMEPNAEIYLHCGNYVQMRHQDFYDRFSKNVEVYNQLSYFLIIEEPEVDGELTVFNANWSDYSNRDGEERLISKKDKTVDPYSLGATKVAPAIGDLFIFAGGKYWHRVEKVLGQKNRITIGGFIGKSKKADEIFIWS
ncbi:MAG: hypothetical protein ACI9EQ_000325 [Bacteroidia bacterium]|jgi:hypothetical protein